MSETSQTEATKPNPATASPEAAPAANAAAAGPEELILAAKKEAAANFDRYMRAVADLENFRKRTLREKDELRQFATSGLMEDVIPIIDTLSLGLTAARQQTEVKGIVDGMTLVQEQLKTTLGRHGLKEVKPEGQRFDPNFHECISHQPSAEVAEEHVMQVVRPGYTLNGRLLRPASVVVSSGPVKEPQA
jgi:molecular chaperone GrpE